MRHSCGFGSGRARAVARCLVALQALGAAAAKADGAAAAPDTLLDDVNVVATRTPHTVRETAGSVTVIDQQRIETELVQNISDLVRYEPDLSVSRDPARFGLGGFTIRGIGGNRVLELVDGIPVSDTFSIGNFSDAGRNTVDPELVRRVEILRGAASALYGSDAIGGVVCFTTKDPQDYLAAGRPWQGVVRGGYNSVDNSHVETALAALGNQADALELLYSRRDGHATGNRGDVDSQDATRTEPNPQDYYDNNFLAKGVFHRGDTVYRLIFSGTQGGTDTNVLSSVGSQDLSSELGLPPGSYVIDTHTQTGDDQQRSLRLSGEAELHHGAWYDNAVLRLYGIQSAIRQDTLENRDETDPNPQPPPATVDTPLLILRQFRFEQDLIGLSASFDRTFNTGAVRHQLAYGLDFRGTRTSELRDGGETDLQTGAFSKTVTPDTFPTRDFPVSLTYQGGVYLQDEIQPGQRLHIIPAVRVDYYRLDPQNDSTYAQANPAAPVAGLSHTSVSPKLGLLYDIAGAWTAYAQYAHGFRAPPYDDVNVGFTNLEFGYTAIPNPNLKPESSDGGEAGLRFEQGGASASAAVYYSRYRDFIEPYVSLGTNPATGLLTYQAQNFTAVRIYGAALNGAYAFERWRGLRLRAALNYTRGDNLQDHAPLNSIDPAKGVLGLEYAEPRQRWDSQLALTVAQRQKRVDQSGGGASSGSYNAAGSGSLFQSPGYARLDLFGWWALSPALRINAGVFNLTNQKYWDWSAVQGQYADNPAIDRYTSPGINGSVSLRYVF